MITGSCTILLLMLSVALGGIGCKEDLGPSQVPDSAATMAEPFAIAGSIVSAVGGPLTSTSGDIQDGDTDQTNRDRIERAVGGNPDGGGIQPAAHGGAHLVEAATCVTFAWMRLTATVTFDQCVLESSGELLDGSASVTIAFLPARVIIDFSTLTIGTRSFDGSFTIGNTGLGDNRTTTVTADLTFSLNGGSTTVALDRVEVVSTTAGWSVDGSGAISQDGATTSLTASDVVFAAGDCLPTSGTLGYTDGGAQVTITFLPTTPDDGVVQLQVGNFQPITTQLLPACP